MALLSVLSSAVSPADTFKRILNRVSPEVKDLGGVGGGGGCGIQKSLNLLILCLCKKNDEQWQESKKVKVMLLRPGTAALCVGLSA